MSEPLALPDDDSGVRLAELMAALSIATDLGMGQPMEHAMCSCIVAVRLGQAAGLKPAELRDAYYEALLRYIGCNAETAWLASIVGDELQLRTEFAQVDAGNQLAVLRLMLQHMHQAHADLSALAQVRALWQGLRQLPQVASSFFPGHCEVASRLAQRLGFEPDFVATIGQLYARWDGTGVPALKGEQIRPAMQVALLAQDAVIFMQLGGLPAACDMARQRRGKAHAPAMVDIFLGHAASILADLDQAPLWEQVLALEPGHQRNLSHTALDQACEAMADFADLKSPFHLGHSRAVAQLASATAQRLRLDEDAVCTLRRAAWLHDIGRVGVSAAVWTQPGRLSDRQLEQMRLHPYHTERVLARPTALARIGALACSHHERLDGSGYWRALSAPMLSVSARILAAVDTYCALCQARPHRPAVGADQAAQILRDEVRQGRLDPTVVEALLACAGHVVRGPRSHHAAGLTDREIQVLQHLARGATLKLVARELDISVKTVDRHVQNIYNKIGVSTRAGATLFAVENSFL